MDDYLLLIKNNNKIMKLVKFLKLINNKIDKYEKMTQTNPFVIRKPITLIWVDKKTTDEL